MTVTRTASGWIISSSGRQGPPIDLTTTKFEMTYTPDWQPVQLTIDGMLGGKALKLSTSFGLTTAITDLTQGEKTGTATQVVSARTIVLPNNFYAGYEALAARLGKGRQARGCAGLRGRRPPVSRSIASPPGNWSGRPVGGVPPVRSDVQHDVRKLPVEIWTDSHDRMASDFGDAPRSSSGTTSRR